MSAAIDVASLGAAAIAAAGSWLARRSAGKATVDSTTITSRLDMEKEAYERARALDTETIERQEREIKELRELREQDRQRDREKDARLQRQEEEIRRLKAQIRALARRFRAEGVIDGARIEDDEPDP